jgi:hypothetical protein
MLHELQSPSLDVAGLVSRRFRVGQLRAIERFLNRGEGFLIAMMAARQLGDDAQLLARNACVADRPSQFAFIFIVEGRIQQAITIADCDYDGLNT